MDKGTKANFIWTVGVLAVALIVVGTVRMPTSERLTDLVSFAATVAALILSVFAIFQGALASAESSQASREASALNVRTTAMLESISQSIPEIRTNVAEIRQQVATSSAFGKQVSPERTENTTHRARAPEDADDLIKASTIMAVVAIYAALLSFRANKPIPFKVLELKTTWHTFGVISGLRSGRWLKFTYSSDLNAAAPLMITYVDSALADKFEILKSRLEKYSPDSFEYGEVKKLEDYFSQFD